jgi:hypothetical protein
VNPVPLADYHPLSICNVQDYFELYVCPPVPALQGRQASDHAGLSLDSGGDWNGDGIIDLIVGGGGKLDPHEQAGGDDCRYGAVRIALDAMDTSTWVTDACTGDPGTTLGPRPVIFRTFRIEGEQRRGEPFTPDATFGAGGAMYADRFGWAVRFVGDILPDAPLPSPLSGPRDEIAVGAPFFDVDNGSEPPHDDAGAVYLMQYQEPTGYTGTDDDVRLILHPPTPATPTNPCDPPASEVAAAPGLFALRITGPRSGSLFGYAICDEVDFDGDGVRDLVVGAPAYPARQNLLPEHPWTDDDQDGEVYFLPGSSLAALPPGTTIRADQVAGAKIISGSFRDRFGASLASLGDIDGIVGAEVLIGAPQFRSDYEPALTDRKSPGDSSDDQDKGSGYVEIWRAGGSAPALLHHVSPDPEVPVGLEPRKQRFGHAFAGVQRAPGVPRTGFVVGAPRFNRPDGQTSGVVHQDAGRVYRYPLPVGAPLGVTWVVDGDRVDDRFGATLASGGDWDADGTADILIGAILEDAPDRNGSDCDCITGSRGADNGALYVVSDSCSGGTPGCHATFFGEQRRDRLGFSAVFSGVSSPSGGGYVFSGALAYPDNAGSGGLKSELGRTYLLDEGLQSLAGQ